MIFLYIYEMCCGQGEWCQVSCAYFFSHAYVGHLLAVVEVAVVEVAVVEVAIQIII